MAPAVSDSVSTYLSLLPNANVVTVVEPCVSVALTPLMGELPAVTPVNRKLILAVAVNVSCAFCPGSVVTVAGVPALTACVSGLA